MKKLLCLCALILSITINASAINELEEVAKDGTVTGKVIDAITQESLPYVTIVIKDSENNILTGGITDENGSFEIEKIPLGENIIEIQFIGYETVSKTVTFTKNDDAHNLGTISLNVSADQLDEVEVVAEISTVVQKVDRRVINVGKDLTSAGTTASELLNHVQSVSVDSQTGNVSLRGNENVRVLVDGKPTNVSAAQLLKQIPSTSIKQIELITNPSAKYNPEGMSGMINIVLHKNANKGYNGSVDLGVTQGENTRYNGSFDMNYNTGTVNFFANYGHNGGKSDNNGYVNRLDNDSHQDFTFDSDSKSDLLKIGADIYINDKNTFSFYTTQNWFDDLSTGSVLISDESDIVVDSHNNSESDSKTSSYNFNYKLDFAKEGHNIEVEASFSDNNSPENAEFIDLENPDDKFNNYIINIKNERTGYLYNLDYTNPINENGKLELGLEVRNGVSKNESETTQHEYVLDVDGNQIPDPINGGYLTYQTPDSDFRYQRDIYSAYATYGHKFDKVTIQLGSRFEQYKVDAIFNKGNESEIVTDDIFTIYPSAFVTYNPSDKNQFQVSYSRRVDRPSLQQVNPIREWSTPRITSVGNPELRPQYTNSFEVNYTRKIEKGSVSAGTFYRRVNDNITRIINTDPLDENKVLLSYTNNESNNRYGFEASANYAVAKWWRINASTDLYIEEVVGTANGDELQITNTAFNARINNNFKATDNLRFQLFGMFRGGGQNLQFKVDPMWMVNAGASYNILKGKGTINFRVNDIFKGMKFAFESTNPYPSQGQFNWESRTAFLGFNYSFSGGKNKTRNRKNRDDNESEGGGFL